MSYTDAITFDPIAPENLITLVCGSNTHYFDVNTLYRSYADNGQDCPTNPFTREPLDEGTTKRVLAYGESLKVLVSCDTSCFRVENYKSVGYMVCKLLTNLENVEMDFLNESKSVYDKDLDKDVVGEDTCLTLQPFATQELKHQALNKLLDYTKDKLWDKGTSNYVIHSAAERSLARSQPFLFDGHSYGTGMLEDDLISANTFRSIANTFYGTAGRRIVPLTGRVLNADQVSGGITRNTILTNATYETGMSENYPMFADTETFLRNHLRVMGRSDPIRVRVLNTDQVTGRITAFSLDQLRPAVPLRENVLNADQVDDSTAQNVVPTSAVYETDGSDDNPADDTVSQFIEYHSNAFINAFRDMRSLASLGGLWGTDSDSSLITQHSLDQFRQAPPHTARQFEDQAENESEPIPDYANEQATAVPASLDELSPGASRQDHVRMNYMPQHRMQTVHQSIGRVRSPEDGRVIVDITQEPYNVMSPTPTGMNSEEITARIHELETRLREGVVGRRNTTTNGQDSVFDAWRTRVAADNITPDENDAHTNSNIPVGNFILESATPLMPNVEELIYSSNLLSRYYYNFDTEDVD